MNQPPEPPESPSPPEDGLRASSATDAPGEPMTPESDAPRSGEQISRLRSYRNRRRAKKAQRSKLRRRLTRSVIAIVLVIVALVGAGVGYTIYRFNQLTRIHVPNLTRSSGKAVNILLIGSTNRCAATQIAVFKTECEQGVNGINSDVVMVVRIVPATHRLTLLSIPRDTFVPDARAGGLYNKIDAALANGPGQLAAAISQDFGFPINHFVELNFGSFENVVNALGGINVYFPYRLYDAENPPLDITHTGCIHLGGNEALALVRSRHLYYFKKGQKPNYAAIQLATKLGYYYTSNSGGSYDGTGDLGRIVRVHEFLRIVAKAVASRGLGNFATDNALIGAIAPYLIVDDSFGDSEIVHLGLAIKDANFSNAPQLTLPIVVDASTYYYKGYNYGDVVFPSAPQDQQAIDQFLGTTPPGLKLSPRSISVSVVDGTNSATATASVADRLHRLGYRIVPTSASNYVGPISETTVVYGKGHLQEAERVLSSLAGTVIMALGTPAGGADVSVIAGSDLTVASSSSNAVAVKTTADLRVSKTGLSGLANTQASPSIISLKTSVRSAPTTTNPPNFSSPTSATTSLAPWDPRSCPTSTKH